MRAAGTGTLHAKERGRKEESVLWVKGKVLYQHLRRETGNRHIEFPQQVPNTIINLPAVQKGNQDDLQWED